MKELFNRVWKKEEGFSLIELIIVIAILAIIAAIAVPNLLGNIQNANEATDESNAKLIADALATAVAQDSTLEGVDLIAVSLGDTLVAADTSGTLADAQQLLDDAELILNNAIPELKANAYQGTTNDFIISLSTTGQVTITNDETPAVVVFPTPQN
jgi:type IV pilus assembly protein PilA